MNRGNTAVLMVNLGSPKTPKVKDVRTYLGQFLNDPRVIDISPALRKVLVNLIIVPFRAPKSAKIYKELWTEEGSPLITISEDLKSEMQKALPDDYDVFLAMRYQNPSIPNILEEIRKGQYKKLIVLPLFPQYASATNGSVIEEVMRVISKWWVIPELRFISQYYDREDYIDAWEDRGKEYDHNEYDHVLFSYHGLPTRQVDKVYDDGLCEDKNCEEEVTRENYYCYKSACFATTRLIAGRLGIPEEKYTVCFQSRLDKNWLEPFSDKVVEDQAKNGAKKLLVFSPAFVADCLETTIEIGVEYEEIFHEHGGEKLTLVESLNTHPLWVKSLKNLIEESI